MTKHHEKSKKTARVSETMPVQVFLGHADRGLLDRLTEQLDLTKSEVLRRGLAALERMLLSPASHPALSVVGLVDGDDGMVGGVDAALHHDSVLADQYEYGATRKAPRRRGKA